MTREPPRFKESIYKGVPKSEWARVRAEHAAKKQANALEDAIPAFVPEPFPDPVSSAPTVEMVKAPEVPRETLAPNPLPRKEISLNEPVDLFSGAMLRLKVYSKDGDDKDPIPGFRTYWFDDADGSRQRLALAERSGWQFVDKDEVLIHDGAAPGSNDLGSNVTVGIPGSNPPRYMYLMKQPLELANKFAQEREEKLHKPIWDMLRGTAVPKSLESPYRAGPGSSMPHTHIDTKVYK